MAAQPVGIPQLKCQLAVDGQVERLNKEFDSDEEQALADSGVADRANKSPLLLSEKTTGTTATGTDSSDEKKGHVDEKALLKLLEQKNCEIKQLRRSREKQNQESFSLEQILRRTISELQNQISEQQKILIDLLNENEDQSKVLQGSYRRWILLRRQLNLSLRSLV